MARTERTDILARLATASLRVLEVETERDELIFEAIEKGCSEREIGRAALMSGPAIHYRKAMLKTSKSMKR